MYECKQSIVLYGNYNAYMLTEGKVVPVLNLLNNTHEDFWRSGSIVPLFLTFAPTGVEWSPVLYDNFILTERPSSITHVIEGWVGPRAGLDHAKKRTFLIIMLMSCRTQFKLLTMITEIYKCILMSPFSSVKK
jgi:hypothetical protein